MPFVKGVSSDLWNIADLATTSFEDSQEFGWPSQVFGYKSHPVQFRTSVLNHNLADSTAVLTERFPDCRFWWLHARPQKQLWLGLPLSVFAPSLTALAALPNCPPVWAAFNSGFLRSFLSLFPNHLDSFDPQPLSYKLETRSPGTGQGITWESIS